MTKSSTAYDGACHCAAVGFVYRTGLAPEEWPIRACQCTFCRRHAGLTTSDPQGSLAFVERAPAALQRYRFGRNTADFLICRNCGVYIGAAMQSGSQGFGIINVRVLHTLLDRLQAPQPMDYDNESGAGRVARREGRWTPLTAD